jgi:hypothetical protein
MSPKDLNGLLELDLSNNLISFVNSEEASQEGNYVVLHFCKQNLKVQNVFITALTWPIILCIFSIETFVALTNKSLLL